MGEMAIRRCGECFFGKLMPQDFSKRICWGAPPSAIQMQATNGKVTMQMTRPVVAVSDEACALWRAKTTVETARDVNIMQEHSGLSETKQ